MINSSQLLADLQAMLRSLEDDLRHRCEENPQADAPLQEQYRAAKAANRTAQAYPVWRDELITQVGVAWILGSVFVRFIEDNGLIQTPYLSGPGQRLALARDQHTEYFRQHPTDSDRNYLEHVFRTVAQLPSLRELFDQRHNPLWTIGISGDAAGRLLSFFQQIDGATGQLNHDFTDPDWGTRFLGDLYQDLSESARKKYALLQTPEFVEEFILDRTLTPAINTFGLKVVRMIDCTCGSGHFALGGFRRLLRLWLQVEPATNVRELVQRALNGVYGVDLNPFAVAIARFRLLIAALRACDIHELRHTPGFTINLAVGDSLLHGARPGLLASQQTYIGGEHAALADPLQHVYETEDADELRRILGQQYHAVVGNPPYITVKDRALNQEYRKYYGSCHRKYSLAAPFMERFFDLAVKGDPDAGVLAGYVGMITTNAFMKREFGKKLVEEFIPKWDLTHVLDTAGAYIPGHGTPTVILFGKNQRPVAQTIRVVMGITGEPSTPHDAAHGLVWTAILNQIDQAGSQSEFVSVADAPRQNFHKHPWSIGGGGASELKEVLDDAAESVLDDLTEEVGFMAITGGDEAFTAPRSTWARYGIPCRDFGIGDSVRDWTFNPYEGVAFMYREQDGRLLTEQIRNNPRFFNTLWPLRSGLQQRKMFGKNPSDFGLEWYEYIIFMRQRYLAPLRIAFASVATHNHFIVDRGGKVFKQSAPVAQLKSSSEDDHLALVGLLNSASACFWMKQVFHNKGSSVDQHGARQRTMPFEDFFDHDGTKLKQFPVPEAKPLELGRALDQLGRELEKLCPTVLLENHAIHSQSTLTTAHAQWLTTIQHMIALQEELDWECYRLYGLLEDDLRYRDGDMPPIKLGERSFEIVMARQMAAGELETTWFERHSSTPITEIPAHWPAAYRQLVARRIAVIAANRDIALIEKPEYKRRWNTEPWHQQLERALREWLLNRLEDPRHWPQIEIISTARLADRVRQDAEFMRVAELYRGRADFDLTGLITELVEAESVPFLPVHRYRATGLRKREVWEHVWDLQRQEDAIDAEVGVDAPGISDTEKLERQTEAKRLKQERIGDIPVPPKYSSTDFRSSAIWKLRGKLDVPKERFISYPGAEREADQSLVIAWAGWDHLQQAQALSAYYERVRGEGWTDARLLPLLAGMQQLISWLLQWHNEVDPNYAMRMGDFYRDFVRDECRRMQQTEDDLRRVAYGG